MRNVRIFLKIQKSSILRQKFLIKLKAFYKKKRWQQLLCVTATPLHTSLHKRLIPILINLFSTPSGRYAACRIFGHIECIYFVDSSFVRDIIKPIVQSVPNSISSGVFCSGGGFDSYTVQCRTTFEHMTVTFVCKNLCRKFRRCS